MTIIYRYNMSTGGREVIQVYTCTLQRRWADLVVLSLARQDTSSDHVYYHDESEVYP